MPPQNCTQYTCAVSQVPHNDTMNKSLYYWMKNTPEEDGWTTEQYPLSAQEMPQHVKLYQKLPSAPPTALGVY